MCNFVILGTCRMARIVISIQMLMVAISTQKDFIIDTHERFNNSTSDFRWMIGNADLKIGSDGISKDEGAPYAQCALLAATLHC